VVAPNDTLSSIDYNYRYELYGGFAYSHFNAGPTLLQGANLGGFDVSGSRFWTRKWAAQASVRGYLGTSGVVPNAYGVKGPFVAQYMFLAGPEYRWLANPHASITLHALVGGAYGQFDSDIAPAPNPGSLGLFNNQTTFATALGGTIDLNRNARWAFRITPEGTLTNYGSAGIHEQIAISVGVVYRLGHKIGPTRPGQPMPAASRGH
jgi:hypothetical protein